MNMTTHLHHLDPASSRAARVASALMRLERENVKLLLARRLLESDIERRNATTLPTTHPNGLAK